MQKLSEGRQALSSDQRQGASARLEAIEEITAQQILDLRQLTASVRQQQQEIHSTFEALENSLSDQRQTLNQVAANFGRDAYTQRLEFQGRISALDTELQNHFTAIEAGLADQRYAMLKLVSSVNGGVAANGDQAQRGGVDHHGQAMLDAAIASSKADEIDRKLGLVLDCLLADHLAELAQASRLEGVLEEEAHQRLQEALDAIKIDRLRDRHEQGPEAGRGGGSAAGEGSTADRVEASSQSQDDDKQDPP